MSNSLWCYRLWPARLLCPQVSPGKNTRVGCHALLQGVDLKGYTTWDLQVKFYLGQNEDCRPGGNTLNGSDRLFQRSTKEEGQYIRFWWRQSSISFSSVQSLSTIWHFVTPWTAEHQASLSITSSCSFLKLETVMPSNHLILCHLLLLPSIFPSIKVLSNESVLHIRCSKYWSFSFNISPSNEYSGLVSFRIDCFDSVAVQGTLKSLLNTTVQKHHFFSTQPSLWSNSHIYT